MSKSSNLIGMDNIPVILSFIKEYSLNAALAFNDNDVVGEYCNLVSGITLNSNYE